MKDVFLGIYDRARQCEIALYELEQANKEREDNREIVKKRDFRK